jgi:hypothetical protein
MDSENEELVADDLSGEESDTESETPVGTSKKKRRSRKLLVISGVIVAVIVVTGVGGWIWHEQPSFCSAFCHSPMDSYVEGFYSGDSNLLAVVHADAQEECLDCHEPTVQQQIQEFATWTTGDFKDPLPMTKTGTKEFCLRSGCHDDFEAAKVATENYNGTARNPHDSHYGDALECYTCHRVHRESTLYCNQCHPDMSIPVGWV